MAAPTETGAITSIGIAATTLTIWFDSIPNATSYEIAYRESSTTDATIVSSNSTSYIIAGLSPLTEYVVNYRGVSADGVGPFMSSGEIVMTRPTYFSWLQDSPAYERPDTSPLSSGMMISVYITAKRWGNLVSNIYDLQLYKGSSGNALSIPSTGDRITASIYNECLRALAELYHSDSYDYDTYKVSAGDKITATHMNRLMNWANYLV